MQTVAPPRTEAAVDAMLHALMSMGRRMRQRVAGETLDPGTFWLLKTVATLEPARATDLAASTSLDVSTVSRHLAQLEKTGLVRRSPDPVDGRAQLVELSADGRAHLDASHERRRALLTTSLSAWPDDDVDTFHRLLTRFAESVDATPVEPGHTETTAAETTAAETIAKDAS